MILEKLKDITIPTARILVSPVSIGETKTQSGLITSLANKEKDRLDGIVQIIGPGTNTSLTIGDIIRFDGANAKRSSINGDIFYILSNGEEDVEVIIGKIINGKPEFYVDE